MASAGPQRFHRFAMCGDHPLERSGSALTYRG
jgi:hypothetical protein